MWFSNLSEMASNEVAGDYWPQRQTRSLSLACAACRSGRRHFGAERVIEVERTARNRETLLHHCVVLGKVTHHAAVLERQTVGIFEVDRLSPSVIDDVGDLYSLVAQLIPLLGQRSRRTGLESKMIEAGGDAQSAIDASIVCRRHVGDSVRLQKSNKLITPDIEKEVPKAP